MSRRTVVADKSPFMRTPTGSSMPQNNIRDERIKLFATYVNTLAAGSFVAGFVAPLVTLATKPNADLFPASFLPLIFVILSVALHLLAQAILGKLGQ